MNNLRLSIRVSKPMTQEPNLVPPVPWHTVSGCFHATAAKVTRDQGMQNWKHLLCAPFTEFARSCCQTPESSPHYHSDFLSLMGQIQMVIFSFGVCPRRQSLLCMAFSRLHPKPGALGLGDCLHSHSLCTCPLSSVFMHNSNRWACLLQNIPADFQLI